MTGIAILVAGSPLTTLARISEFAALFVLIASIKACAVVSLPGLVFKLTLITSPTTAIEGGPALPWSRLLIDSSIPFCAVPSRTASNRRRTRPSVLKFDSTLAGSNPSSLAPVVWLARVIWIPPSVARIASSIACVNTWFSSNRNVSSCGETFRIAVRSNGSSSP